MNLYKTYVINLERCGTKKTEMEKEFAKVKRFGIDMKETYFKAIDGRCAEQLAQFNYKIPTWFDPNNGKAMTLGEIGCALSHYSVWKQYVDDVEQGLTDGTAPILILEDDACFCIDFHRRFAPTMEKMPKDYDLIYLQQKPVNDIPDEPISETDSSIVRVVAKKYWLCSYMLSYSGAKKLMAANYLDNLIPADEFMPAMYGADANGFEDRFAKCEKLVTYAFHPKIMRLRASAFNESETLHTNAVPVTNFRFDDKYEFKLMYFGRTGTEAYARLERHCQLYGLPLTSYNLTVDHEKTHIDTVVNLGMLGWSETEKRTTLVVALVNNSIHDDALFLPISSPTEIINKYRAMADTPFKIIKDGHSTDRACYCGWANSYEAFTANSSSSGNRGALDASASRSSSGNRGALDASASRSSSVAIIIDNDSDLFYNVSRPMTDNFSYLEKRNRIKINSSGKMPSILMCPSSDAVILNQAENYTGRGWNEYYGYRYEKYVVDTLPKVLILFDYKHNNRMFDFLETLEYPKTHYTVHVLHNGRHMDWKKYVGDVANTAVLGPAREYYYQSIFEKSDAEYLFLVGPNTFIKRADVLGHLLSHHKSLIAPLLLADYDKHSSNMWGMITYHLEMQRGRRIAAGWYKKSFDYGDIIDGTRRGCWNVPYVTETYLMHRSVLAVHTDIYASYNEEDIDMRFCRLLREKGVFMYVTNMEDFGMLNSPCAEPSLASIEHQNRIQTLPQDSISRALIETYVVDPAVNRRRNNIERGTGTSNVDPASISIYDVKNNPAAWELKYLHPEFYKNMANLSAMQTLNPCIDVHLFPLFSTAFCKELIQRMEDYGKWSAGLNNHNDVRRGANYYENHPTQDIHMYQIGFDDHWKHIVHTYVAPMAEFFYTGLGTKGINIAFVVKYDSKLQNSLGAHHDAAKYTINVALNEHGSDYEGGGCELLRKGVKITQVPVGCVTIHLGLDYHRGLPTTKGTRYILVSFNE